MVELAPVPAPAHQRPEIDDHGDVRSLRAGGGPGRGIQPLATNLCQRVCPTLWLRSVVVAVLPPPLGVQTTAQRAEDDLSALGVQVAVDADHAEHGDRDVETSLVVHPLGVLQAFAPIQPPAPVRHRVMELRRREALRRLDQGLLGAAELSGMGVSCRDEHLHRGRRQLASR